MANAERAWESVSGADRFPEFDRHEGVFRMSDPASGLLGFIAIHSTAAGPAVGGTRYWHYASEEEAVRDVLRLSRAMSYKCALAGVPYGGGKAVIMADSRQPKSGAMLREYAERINALRGAFYTGEDVGIDQADVTALAEHSSFIIGRETMAGDPGPWASLGVFHAMAAAIDEARPGRAWRDVSVAIQGLGKVGLGLARLVSGAGGRLIAADINPAAVAAAVREFPGLRIVNAEDIHRQDADVFSPNALGGVIAERMISELRCYIVCGGANNQLASDESARLLYGRGILYIPDYVANAGGLIDVVDELSRDGYSRDRVLRRTAAIGGTVRRIVALSREQGKSPSEIADALGAKILEAAAAQRLA